MFPRRTRATPLDELAFVGSPPLYRPEADEVHISVAFTWDREWAMKLAAEWGHYYPTRIAGPALGTMPANGFTPGMYLKPGYTITSRGCPNRCPWCLVPGVEGGLREIEPVPEGHNVLDNNLLACSDAHIEAVFGMLAAQKRRIQFTGGLEADRVTPSIVEDLRSLRIAQLFLAYDAEARWTATLKAIKRLRLAGLRLRQLRCFVLAGRGDDTPEAAEERCKRVLAAGALPFMMLYQPPDRYIGYSDAWRRTRRKWTRPAAMLAGRSDDAAT